MKIITLLLLTLSLFGRAQDGFNGSTEGIKNGKVYLIAQRSGIGDCSDKTYFELSVQKAEITNVETEGNMVKSFNFNHGEFWYNDKWIWDESENPIAFDKGKTGTRVVLYPYKGNLYFLTKPFYVNVIVGGTVRRNGENKDVCLTGWTDKKKPKISVDSYNKKIVVCPVTIEELREDALKNLQARKRSDDIKYPPVISTKDQKVLSYQLKTEWSLSSDQSSTTLKIGVEAALENGKTILTNNFEGGLGLYTDYIVETYGGCLEHTKYVSGQFNFRFDLSSRKKAHLNEEDYVNVIVKSKATGEILINKKVPIAYNASITLDFSNPSGSFCQGGWDGGEVDINVEETNHSETNELLLQYAITVNNYYENNETFYVKLNPESKLTIFNSGGRGGDCNGSNHKPGGQAGAFTTQNNTSIDLSKLELIAASGREGNVYVSPPSDYDPSSSSDQTGIISSSSSSSNEITIKNSTGKSVCIAHYGGSTTIGNGSSETFSCRDLYYGVMEGANCTGTKGALIASKSQCGQTIALD